MLIGSVLLYFAASGLLAALGSRRSSLVSAVALAPFIAQLFLVGAMWGDESAVAALEWIPAIGLTLEFSAAPLNLVLTAVVAGIGLLITGYSISYFADTERRARFLALMMMFSGGMAGLVVSDGLFGLFVFWEVTTVASYLLIGFDHHSAAARASALQAILVTAAGGLALLGGFVLLGLEAGTSSISSLVADPPASTLTTVALLLVFAGAFTKSAQFPFHFWLPGAMAAPTPASAYLHSATMVKAGIVLLLFLAPAFGAEPVWTWTVTTVGLITMLVGAVGAMRRTDLKLLLAHGTVSQLGLIVALVGLNLTGTGLAVLVGHALFKAALFLIVGAVDKATGTRDIGRLSGLAGDMPLAAVAGGVAALSMAGAAPLLGFATKELAIDDLIATGNWVPLVVVAAASVLTVSYSARFWFGAFGKPPSIDRAPVSAVPANLVIAPVVLGVLTAVLGIFPGRLGSILGDSVGTTVKLVLWPGLKPALLVSALIVIAGFVTFATQGRWERSRIAGRFPTRSRGVAEAGYVWALRSVNVAAERVTGVVQNGSLPVYLAVILSAVLTVPTVSWLAGFRDRVALPISNEPAEVALVAVLVCGAVATTLAQRRMAAVLLLGVVGYAVAGIYTVFGAPDLALTQLLIETLTIALFALVLVRLPRRFGPDPQSVARRTRLAVSVLVGAFVATAAVLASSVEHDRTIADSYVELAPEAGGRNVVNVVLTNFRAIDTLGEITVLAAAAIGISVLVRTARRRTSDLPS